MATPKLKAIDLLIEDDSGKWNSGFNQTNYITDFGKFLIHQTEFEERAKQLGYINGYRWGVEYPTNGKKPDLPDDLVVCTALSENDTCEGIAYPISMWMGWDSDAIYSFKIVDERYKPADTSYLENPAVEPVSIDEIAMAKKEFARMSTAFQDLMQESFDKVITRMEEKRKAEAEKKRVVDAATEILYKHACATKGELIDGAKALYDLGYLRLPEQK
jgi:hypothetical protein